MKTGVLINIATPEKIAFPKLSDNRKKGTLAEDINTKEKRQAQNKKQDCYFSFLFTTTLTVRFVCEFLSEGERLSI